jgi:Alw26I/Eco31I/Esp3I family type II restriction m6 adenine DNA methyltransferase
MEHVELLREARSRTSGKKDLLTRVTGRFYTHEFIAQHMVSAILRAWLPSAQSIRVVEPFCGDGRLVELLLSSSLQHAAWIGREWDISLWDCDAKAVAIAKRRLLKFAADNRLTVRVNTWSGDTFQHAPAFFGNFDLCITNPPWEVLKPDRREIELLNKSDAEAYVRLLRAHDELLRNLFPLSAPLKRFSGWGTNLARCGVEVVARLLAPGGFFGVVSPASLLADQMFSRLRKWLLSQHSVHDIAFYAAEARLFENVDQPCITLVASSAQQNGTAPRLSTYDKTLRHRTINLTSNDWASLGTNGFVVPLQFGLNMVRLQSKWNHLPCFVDLEGVAPNDIWAGRELDETGYETFMADRGDYLFTKGRMIRRFGFAEQPEKYVRRSGPLVPKSADHPRIAWRDVARTTQKRRMHAALIPPGFVTGNSLNVAYFRDDNMARLKALLGIMNSLVFEAQVRSYLATGHISLGAVRQVRLPLLNNAKVIEQLAELTDAASTDPTAETALEVEIARLYGLSREEFSELLICFPKIDECEAEMLLSKCEWDRPMAPPITASKSCRIPNHYSATLSSLDLQVAKAVPPGGNWKNIPESVPSQRLEQIRVSYAAGEGSRSTYYGRLHPNAPSYTISTYFSRPGNGCHLHYDYDGGQHRVLSQREAARLQSFPDSFVFHGNRSSVNQQIGNAVPPLLAYQIAQALPHKRGQFLDLFSGAGGLALGFVWAGWEPIMANDIEETYLTTYRANIDPNALAGDIRDSALFEALINTCLSRRDPKKPFYVLGGPPCQGFSTAGNRRSMNDDRNWLFQQYKGILKRVHATGFVFENVTGLLNMDGGRVYSMIKRELEDEAKHVNAWKLRAEEYGIPQRRTRIILVGGAKYNVPPPQPVTQLEREPSIFGNLAPVVTVQDALSDLPSLRPGEDGSHKDYVSNPTHPYQSLMRGLLPPDKYLAMLNQHVGQQAG